MPAARKCGFVSSGEVTRFLQELSSGRADAAERLLPLVYDELRALADRYLQRQPPDHTLQPTALVHEAYIRLVGDAHSDWSGRVHFFRVAAKAMRRILIDHARKRCSAKRGGDRRKLPLDDVLAIADYRDEYVMALDEALTELAGIDEQLVQLVELRFFGRLSIEETSQVLGVSPTTVKRLWQIARGWLHQEISKGK